MAIVIEPNGRVCSECGDADSDMYVCDSCGAVMCADCLPPTGDSECPNEFCADCLNREGY